MESLPASALNKLDNKYIKDLNTLLSPANALGKNVAELAGRLDFSSEQISYILEKKYPFIYLMDTWIKSRKEYATLQHLRNELYSMKRLDAVEIVDKAINELKENFQESDIGLERNFISLKRFESNSTLLGSECSLSTFSEVSTSRTSLNSLKKNSYDNSKFDEAAPIVYVVFFPDNRKHIKNVNKFIQILREKYKINASTTDNHAYASASDKAEYYSQKLTQAHYVFIICSPGLKPHFSAQPQPDLMLPQTAHSEKASEISFVSKLFLGDMFKRINNAKYIPILLTNLCKFENIPSTLQLLTSYTFPDDCKKLINRVLKKENFYLPATKTNFVYMNTDSLLGGSLLRLSISNNKGVNNEH